MFDPARLVQHWFIICTLLAISSGAGLIMSEYQYSNTIIAKGVTCQIQDGMIDRDDRMVLILSCPNNRVIKVSTPELVIKAITVQKKNMVCQNQYISGALGDCIVE